MTDTKTRKWKSYPEEMRKGWLETANRRRRAEYANDPEYREKAKMDALVQMRKKRGISEDFRDCRQQIDLLGEIGEVRKVQWDDGEYLTFTAQELGIALGDYSLSGIYGLIRKGKIPQPVVPCRVDTKSFGRDGETSEMFVYLEDEVLAMMEIMGEHQLKYHYLRADHYDTIERLFTEVHEVRKGQGLWLYRAEAELDAEEKSRTAGKPKSA